MKHFLLFSLSILCMVLAGNSCKTKKYASLEEAEGKQLTFTYGGGFAGTYTSYILLENGQLYRSHGVVTNYKEVASLDKSQTKQIFSNYDVLNVKDKSLENYGNMSYTITMDDEGEQNKVIWNKENGEAAELQKYFDSVFYQAERTTTKELNDKKSK